MPSLPHAASAVHPAPPDGLPIPRLLPVAAYLCLRRYADDARDVALLNLAAGSSPIACACYGLIEFGDVLPIERIMEGRAPEGR